MLLLLGWPWRSRATRPFNPSTLHPFPYPPFLGALPLPLPHSCGKALEPELWGPPDPWTMRPQDWDISDWQRALDSVQGDVGKFVYMLDLVSGSWCFY